MATLFSSEIMEFLTPIFVFIFIFAAAYALLVKTKFFGEKAGFNLVIAFAVAMLLFVVPEAQVFVTSFTPWAVMLTLLVLFIFMFFMFLGVKDDAIVDYIKSSGFTFWMVVIFIVLFLVALSKAFGPFLMINQQPGFWNAVKRTLFHPKTLGALFILGVAAFAARYLGAHELVGKS